MLPLEKVPIEVVLRGSDINRTVGIDQGNPYSSTALNVRLHHAIDLMQDQHPPRYYRYADNVVYLCRDVSRPEEARTRPGTRGGGG
jgi:hypothetical protein